MGQLRFPRHLVHLALHMRVETTAAFVGHFFVLGVSSYARQGDACVGHIFVVGAFAVVCRFRRPEGILLRGRSGGGAWTAPHMGQLRFPRHLVHLALHRRVQTTAAFVVAQFFRF